MDLWMRRSIHNGSCGFSCGGPSPIETQGTIHNIHNFHKKKENLKS